MNIYMPIWAYCFLASVFWMGEMNNIVMKTTDYLLREILQKSSSLVFLLAEIFFHKNQPKILLKQPDNHFLDLKIFFPNKSRILCT